MGERLVRLVVAVGVLALVAAPGCRGRVGPGPIEGPVLAVVSYSPDEVVLVDPGTLSVIERVPLRSMGTDPLALPGERLFVTAQCGGIGDDADDAIALIDLRRGARARYVGLPEPNPGFVESAGDGTLLVSHGIWSPDGIPVTRVDLATGEVIGRQRIGNAYGALVVAAGSLWTAGPEGLDVADQEYTVRRTSLDLATTSVFPGDGRSSLIVPDGSSRDTVLIAGSDGGPALVQRVSAAGLEVLDSVTIEGLANGVCEVAEAGGLLVLRDSSGEDPTDPGGPLIVLDRATLREIRRVDVGGSVASIAALGETVYAITWDTGELVAADPASGRILRRARVEGLAGRMTQLAAMDDGR